MNTLYDYKRFAILYVDDEEKSLKYFAKAFGDTFRIFTAQNAADGRDLACLLEEVVTHEGGHACGGSAGRQAVNDAAVV